ncbi:hypothetical protein MNBD_NITROSPINAE01-1428 [hydrothermal vent metagenome]|uniref:Cytochrome c domain-containing protein n=1 Tax=hydrothermal vent metagenome TaxID=652676 RepID=A0A3B1BTD9_9ZZZZ
MLKVVFAVVVSFVILTAPAFAADFPKPYKKCKTCHGIPGEAKKKMGPNLANSKLTLEQFKNMVANGSKWDGRPAKQAGFEKKKMKPVKGVKPDDVKTIFEYVQSKK